MVRNATYRSSRPDQRKPIGASLTARPDQTRLTCVKAVNIQEAKTHLSRLLEEAVAGEDIVIAKAGRPYVRLVSCVPENTPRNLGGWEGRVHVAEDFDETPEEIIRLFEGSASRRPTKKRAK